MQKQTAQWILMIAVFLLALGGCDQKPAKQPVIELTYSIFFPPTHAQCKAASAWAKEIEAKTLGRVKIKLFPGETLTKAKDCYDGVVGGISDIGMSCFAYTCGRFPIMEALDLPFGYPDGETATQIANLYDQKMRPHELDAVKVLYVHAHGPGVLHTIKPVNTLADLKGMRIRSTGLSAKVVEALGGVAVAMPQGATYQALQKGVVEGTFAPFETLQGWRQAEVVKYTTNCKGIGYTTAMFVVMNKAKWNALPHDIQIIFDAANRKWIGIHAKAWDEADEDARAYTLSLNNKIIELPDTEMQKWIARVAPIIDAYVTKTVRLGLPGQKAVDTIKSALK